MERERDEDRGRFAGVRRPYSNFEATDALLAEAARLAIPPERIICTGDLNLPLALELTYQCHDATPV